MSYSKKLKEEGFPDNRLFELSMAMSGIHRVLSVMNEDDRKRFLSKPLEERLNEYAETERVANVVTATPNSTG